MWHDGDLKQAQQHPWVSKQKGRKRDINMNSTASYSEYYRVALADALLQSYQDVVCDDLRGVVSSVEDRA